MALVFTLAGFIGLVITLIAMNSGPYKRLTKRYAEAEQSENK